MCKSVLFNKKDIVPIFLIVGTVLLGYHGIFSGADFFLHQDADMLSKTTYVSSMGGWMADRGFGISFFYNDTSSHPWAMLALWEKVVPYPKHAFTTSVVLLCCLAGIALYFFLRSVSPKMGRWVWLLSPLIVFTPHQTGIHFLRIISGLVCIPLLLIVLYNYYNRPKLQHFFYFALIVWFVLLFGTFAAFYTLLSVGFFFTATIYFYFREPLKKFVPRFSLLFILGTGVATLLSFWIYYGIFLEMSLVGYAREKVITIPQELLFMPNINRIVTLLIGFLQIEWLSHEFVIPGRLSFLYSSSNIVALFPLLFVFFLFRRAGSFWEFSLKVLVVVFWMHILLTSIPSYNSFYNLAQEKSMKLINVFDLTGAFIAQIGLIAIFLSEIKKEDLRVRQLWGCVLQKGIAFLLFIFYAGLVLFCILALLTPNLLPTVMKLGVEIFCPNMVGTFSRDFLATYLFDCIHIIQSSMHWYSLIFFSLSAVLVLLFIRYKWVTVFANKPKLIAVLLLISAITMTWSVFPLNKKKLVWEEAAPELPKFEPTDRLYYARHDNSPLLTLEAYNQRLENTGGREGYYTRRYGYEESPALKLHGHKSFTQKDAAEYIYHIFNGDGVKRLINLRSVTEGPLISSELLDMGAVNYYYTRRELLDVPEYLELYFKASNDLNIYKNLNAWPYFYLAEQLGIKKEGKHLENVKQGTAYLAQDDYFPLPENAGESSIELKEFSNGKMVFDFSGNNEEFLVVADAWHPFWKAYAEDKNLPIVKTNEIFKGVRLPNGKYTLTLEFDTSPYLPGVYVSIIFWILFLSAWICVYFRSRHKSLVNVDTP